MYNAYLAWKNQFLFFSILPFFPSASKCLGASSDTSIVSHAHETWLKLGTHCNLIIFNLTQLSSKCYLIRLITHNAHSRERESQTVPESGSYGSSWTGFNWTWIICPNGFYRSQTSLPLFSTFLCYLEPYQILGFVKYNLWRVLEADPVSYQNCSKCI